MSRQMSVTRKCAVCGKESDQIVIVSSNRMGPPDLDLRPPQMMRSTMRWWIQECPCCGYISESLEEHTGVDTDWLKREEFVSVNNLEFKSDLAEKFYKCYLIKLADNNHKGAYNSALHAAWACDDAGDTDNAIYCRKIALEQLSFLIAADRGNENLQVVRMDLLRRSGQFSAVVEEYENALFCQPVLNTIKDFQIKHSRQGDVKCYTVDDCTKE